MEFLKSFTYMFKDEKWYLPLVIGILIEVPTFGLHCLITQASQNQTTTGYMYMLLLMLISIPITLLCSTLIGGYYLVNAHRRTIKPDVELLQWSNFKEIIITGLKSLGASFIYTIPFLIISIIGLIFYMKALYSMSGSTPKFDYMTVQVIVGMLFMLIISTMVFPAFVTNLKFKSFFNFKLMFNLLKNNPKGFGILLLFTIVVGALSFGTTKLFYGSIYMLLISPILAFYFAVVKSELLAQYIRGAANKLE